MERLKKKLINLTLSLQRLDWPWNQKIKIHLSGLHSMSILRRWHGIFDVRCPEKFRIYDQNTPQITASVLKEELQQATKKTNSTVCVLLIFHYKNCPMFFVHSRRNNQKIFKDVCLTFNTRTLDLLSLISLTIINWLHCSGLFIHTHKTAPVLFVKHSFRKLAQQSVYSRGNKICSKARDREQRIQYDN